MKSMRKLNSDVLISCIKSMLDELEDLEGAKRELLVMCDNDSLTIMDFTQALTRDIENLHKTLALGLELSHRMRTGKIPNAECLPPSDVSNPVRNSLQDIMQSLGKGGES